MPAQWGKFMSLDVMSSPGSVIDLFQDGYFHRHLSRETGSLKPLYRNLKTSVGYHNDKSNPHSLKTTKAFHVLSPGSPPSVPRYLASNA